MISQLQELLAALLLLSSLLNTQLDMQLGADKEVKFERLADLPAAGIQKITVNKDLPEVTLEKWNGEVNLKVSYPKVKAKGVQTGNKVEFKDSKEEVHAYPIDDDNFEFEVVLKEKPDTNVFSFGLEGYEDLDFFYQPALTQEEIDEGSVRPENVIGSYAVYHKTKKNHKVGETNYATGKAYHIYRPKVIDANGIEEWALLSYSTGTLSVTVSQEFLDNATYPVKVDPTFGYTNLGATLGPSAVCANSSDTSNTKGHTHTLLESGTLDSIHLGMDATHSETADTFAALYRVDSAGSGSHDLVVSIEKAEGVDTYTTTAAFITFTAASEELSADDYIIAGLCDGEDVVNVGGTIYINSDDTNDNDGYFESSNGAGAYATRKGENPWTETVTANEDKRSVYVTYTAAAPAASPSGRRTYYPTGILQ